MLSSVYNEIECSAQRLLARESEIRSITHEGVVRYLSGLRQLFEGSERNLRASRDAATGPLREYLAAKCAEEDGHATWAEDDLRALGAQPGAPSAAINTLLKFQAGCTPREYAVYALWAETFTALVGPQVLSMLAGAGHTNVSALGKHVGADAGHAAQAVGAFELILGDVAIVRCAALLFDNFVDEVLL